MMYTEMNSARQNLYYNKILRRAQNDRKDVVFTARKCLGRDDLRFKIKQKRVLWRKDSEKVAA